MSTKCCKTCYGGSEANHSIEDIEEVCNDEGCECHKEPQQQSWEEKVYGFLKKECPTKDISRFAPFLEIIREVEKEAYERGYSSFKEEVIHGNGPADYLRVKSIIEKEATLQERTRIVKLVEEVSGDIYPVDVFPEPPEGWKQKLDEWCKSQGYRIDNISGWYARWARGNVRKDLLEAISTNENGV